MYGTGKPFDYFICDACNCLQIREVPADMFPYYPDGYYSFTPAEKDRRRPNLFRRMKYDYLFFKTGFIGRMMAGLEPDSYNQYRCFQNIALNRDSRILEVGCGSGRDLVKMRDFGFRHLKGIDPYLSETIDYGLGLTIDKANLSEMSGEWDVIKFNHVFEHLPDPAHALHQVRRLLAPDGTCIIRQPVVPCYAFEKYGTHWLQLDAPRHLQIFSVQAMMVLADRTGLGLKLDLFYHDSVGDQFWGSELYRRGIDLISGAPYRKQHFSRAEFRRFRVHARKLNRERRGDQAVFYLTRRK